jgi:hypothetical protein
MTLKTIQVTRHALVITKARRQSKAALYFCLAFFALKAWGQGDASITGTVSDQSRAAIPGVSITVKSVESGALRKALTDGSGHYEIPLLGVGSYEVTAEKSSFQTETRKSVMLVLGQRASVDFILQVGAASETIQDRASSRS